MQNDLDRFRNGVGAQDINLYEGSIAWPLRSATDPSLPPLRTLHSSGSMRIAIPSSCRAQLAGHLVRYG
jgi:hypothetical protein